MQSCKVIANSGCRIESRLWVKKGKTCTKVNALIQGRDEVALTSVGCQWEMMSSSWLLDIFWSRANRIYCWNWCEKGKKAKVTSHAWTDRMELSVTEMKKTSDRAGVERDQEFNFRQVHFEIPIIYPSAGAN